MHRVKMNNCQSHIAKAASNRCFRWKDWKEVTSGKGWVEGQARGRRRGAQIGQNDQLLRLELARLAVREAQSAQPVPAAAQNGGPAVELDSHLVCHLVVPESAHGR